MNLTAKSHFRLAIRNLKLGLKAMFYEIKAETKYQTWQGNRESKNYVPVDVQPEIMKIYDDVKIFKNNNKEIKNGSIKPISSVGRR